MKPILKRFVIAVFAMLLQPNVSSPGFACPLSQTRHIAAQRRFVERRVKRAHKIERELIGFSSEGGALTGFVVRGQLRKMTAEYFGETRRATEEFYFSHSRLIVIAREEQRYDRGLYFSPEYRTMKVQSVARSVFYFRAGDLFCTSGSAATQSETELLARTRELIALIQAKPKT